MKKILFSLLLVTILFSCSKNGDKVSQDFMEVYYKDGITKQEAQKALDYFLPRWKEKDGETARKSIQLTKNGDTINFNALSKNRDLVVFIKKMPVCFGKRAFF